MLLTPFRIYCSLGLERSDRDFCNSFNEQGVPHHLSWGFDMLAWADQQPQFLQLVLFTVAFATFGTISVLELLIQYAHKVTGRAGGLAGCALALGTIVYTSKKMKTNTPL